MLFFHSKVIEFFLITTDELFIIFFFFSVCSVNILFIVYVGFFLIIACSAKFGVNVSCQQQYANFCSQLHSTDGSQVEHYFVLFYIFLIVTVLFTSYYICVLTRLIGLVGRVFANGPGDLGSIPGRVIPKTLKMVLDTFLLNTQQHKVCINWSNPGKGVAPFPTPRCCSY